jgi:hypothetical protein
VVLGTGCKRQQRCTGVTEEDGRAIAAGDGCALQDDLDLGVRGVHLDLAIGQFTADLIDAAGRDLHVTSRGARAVALDRDLVTKGDQRGSRLDSEGRKWCE